MANPDVVMTYGTTADGTVAFGGAASETLGIIDWDVELTYSSFMFSAILRVQATTDALFAVELAKLENLKHQSGNFSLVAGATTLYSITEANKVFAYRARTSLREARDPNDHKRRKTYLFSLVATRPATNVSDTGGRRFAQISVSTDSSERRVIAINGLYTGLSGQNALTQYNSNASTYAAGVVATFSGSYELLEKNLSFDDESAEAIFSFVYRERRVPENAAGEAVAAIKDQNLTLSRRSSWNLGLPAEVVPSMAEVVYTASIDSTVVDYTGLWALYTDTIKPHILNQVKARFGVNDTVIMDELPSIRLDASAITVFMQILLKRSSSDLLSFEKTVAWNVVSQKDIRNRWTGVPHDYTSFTPGPRIVAEVEVIETVLGPASFSGSINLRSGQANVLGLNEGDSSVFQRPGFPPFSDDLNGSNSNWIFLGAEARSTPRFVGFDEEGESRAIPTQVTRTVAVTTWLWGTESEARVVSGLSFQSPVPVSSDEGESEQNNFVPLSGFQTLNDRAPGAFLRLLPPPFRGS